MTKPLLVLGARNLAPEVIEIAREAGFKVDGVVENLEREVTTRPCEGLPVYWFEDIRPFVNTHKVVCSLGTTKRRAFIETVAEMGFEFETLVHPSARIPSTATLAAGVIVSPGVVVASHAHIGAHVLLNRGVLIGHHTTVGEFSSLQPGANVAGLCEIGRQAWLAVGSIVLDRISVGDGATVAAGAVVTQDLPDHVVAMGVPAKIVKTNAEPR